MYRVQGNLNCGLTIFTQEQSPLMMLLSFGTNTQPSREMKDIGRILRGGL